MNQAATTYQNCLADLNQLSAHIMAEVHSLYDHKKVASEIFGIAMSNDLTPNSEKLEAFKRLSNTFLKNIKDKTDTIKTDIEKRCEELENKYTIESFITPIKEHRIKIQDFESLIKSTNNVINLGESSEQKLELAYRAFTKTLDSEIKTGMLPRKQNIPSFLALFKPKMPVVDNVQKTPRELAQLEIHDNRSRQGK